MTDEKSFEKLTKIFALVKKESDEIKTPLKLNGYDGRGLESMYSDIQTRIENHGSSCFSSGRLDREWFGPDKELANIFRIIEECTKLFNKILKENIEKEERNEEVTKKDEE